MKKNKVLFALCAAVAAAMFATCLDPNFENPFDSKNLDDDSGGVTQDVTFYCPDECTAEQGASGPDGCFETQSACEESVVPPPPAWDGMSCNSGGDCVEITDEIAWNSCPVENRFTTATCTPESTCEEGVDCDADVGSCTVDDNCANGTQRGNCSGDFVFEGICTFTVNVISNGVGATGGGSGYKQGDTAHINAGTPPMYHSFVNWTTDDKGVVILNPDSSITIIVMPANNVTITANFEYNANGTFVDSRDGQSYRYVTIGDQVWMGGNLNFDPKVTNGSWCSLNADSGCVKYGRLYNWATAMGLANTCNNNSCISQIQTHHQGVCPNGWHLPSAAEWNTLIYFVGGFEIAGTKLKSETGWDTSGWQGEYSPSTDDFGFSALPGGSYAQQWGGGFDPTACYGNWWTATEVYANELREAYSYGMNCFSESTHQPIEAWKINALSVRCVRDD